MPKNELAVIQQMQGSVSIEETIDLLYKSEHPRPVKPDSVGKPQNSEVMKLTERVPDNLYDMIIDFAQFCRAPENFEDYKLKLKKALTDEEYGHATEKDVLQLMLDDFTATVKVDYKRMEEEK